MGVMCQQCGQPIPKRRNQSRVNYAQRKYCCRRCSSAARRSAQIRGKAEQYQELEWLLRNGVEVYEALRRCGIPTADAAYQWALRHDRQALAAVLRAAYNTERAAMHRQQRKDRT